MGGTASTIGICSQVVAPVGPYTGGFTSRISRIDSQGNRATVADHLPSSQTSDANDNSASGVSDIAFIGREMFALTAGAGCSNGLVHTNNGVLQIYPNGAWRMVADLSLFQKLHPRSQSEPCGLQARRGVVQHGRGGRKTVRGRAQPRRARGRFAERRNSSGGGHIRNTGTHRSHIGCI